MNNQTALIILINNLMKPWTYIRAGVYLPLLCHKQRSNPRRAMVELLSNGAAPAPVALGSQDFTAAAAPASAPSSF